eukprot:TRINITY_DN6667_c1_g1_i1.p1 TRINITY_DN6667_c1_g1~~TRINITY_DN6667_c1_g1_i1.p1  ORF type:complete len:555 (-),score=87.61 TRINITY_DN6667_c1_g1_i1:9-1673(-)
MLLRAISDRKAERAFSGGSSHVNPLGFIRRWSADISCVKRMEKHAVLNGHSGCVNSVNWSTKGDKLCSGSDDTTVYIWNYDQEHVIGYLNTGHTANIFCALFLASDDDHQIVCCAGDGQVRYCRASCAPRVFSCHENRVKKLVVEPGSSHVFMSCSEDGTVRRFDLRESHTCTGSCTASVLIDRRVESSGGVFSMALNKIRPWQLITGGCDEYVRLYDIRRPTVPVKQFGPAMIGHTLPRSQGPAHITGVAYNYDGTEILASYSGDGIILYNVDPVRSALAEESEPHRNVSGKRERERAGDDGAAAAAPNQDESVHPETLSSILQEHARAGKRFAGHRNVMTIKECDFYGSRSEFILSGSDDGRIFFWEKSSGRIVNVLKGDRHVVNCIKPHPFDACVASSGIENNVKLWQPTAPEMCELNDLDDIVRANSSVRSRIFLPGPTHLLQLLRLVGAQLFDNFDDDDMPRLRRRHNAGEEPADAPTAAAAAADDDDEVYEDRPLRRGRRRRVRQPTPPATAEPQGPRRRDRSEDDEDHDRNGRSVDVHMRVTQCPVS